MCVGPVFGSQQRTVSKGYVLDIVFLQMIPPPELPLVSRLRQITGEVGSYRYMAPEVVRHEPYNTKADIYSWGILTWEIMSIDKPYAWVTKESTFFKVVYTKQTQCRPARKKHLF